MLPSESAVQGKWLSPSLSFPSAKVFLRFGWVLPAAQGTGPALQRARGRGLYLQEWVGTDAWVKEGVPRSPARASVAPLRVRPDSGQPAGS